MTLGDYKIMDTSIAEKYSDEELIRNIQTISFESGWGLFAELLKRFDMLREKRIK